MRFIYILTLGFISLLVATEALLNIVKLSEFQAVILAFIISANVMILLVITNGFKEARFKKFSLSVLVGIISSIVALTVLEKMSIGQHSSSLLIGLVIGIYSYEKMSFKKDKINKQSNYSKEIHCPCCKKEISIKYYLKQFLITKSKNGFSCENCNRTVFSADKKVYLTVTYMMVSMIPIFLLGLKGIPFLLDNILFSIFILFISFAFFVFLIYRKYYYLAFTCDDKNSSRLIKYFVER